jgi:hypothetical protein
MQKMCATHNAKSDAHLLSTSDYFLLHIPVAGLANTEIVTFRCIDGSKSPSPQHNSHKLERATLE